MTTPQILREGWAVYRHYFGQLLCLSALTYVPLVIIGYMIALESMPLVAGVQDGKILVGSEEALDRLNLVLMGVGLLIVIGTIFSMASLHYAIGDAYLRGECDWRDSIHQTIRRLPAIAAAGAIIAALVALLALICFALVTAGGILAVVGVVGTVVATVVLLVLATFLIPVAVREDIPATLMLARTWELARPRWRAIIGLLLLLGLSVGAIHALVRGGIQGGFTGSGSTVSHAVLGIFIADAVPSVLLTPLSVSVLTIAYFDMRRVRGDTLDDRSAAPRASLPTGPRVLMPLSDTIRSHSSSPAPMPGWPQPLSTTPGGESAPPSESPPVTLRPRWSEPLGPQ